MSFSPEVISTPTNLSPSLSSMAMMPPFLGRDIIGRNTQGVTLIKIAKGEKLVSIAKIAETEDESGIPEEEAE
jgi:hypothetical protein